MVEATRGVVAIKPIDKASVHRICSGQVILDLSMAVKELVENSLDAGATSIEIKLKDYGADSFEVADNGCGVSPENYQALTLKYHTSKISEFSDLQSLSSFGFRGEALSSLCALGELSVVTRTKNETIATQLQFDHSGCIISQKSEARPVGTTVIVSGLFKSLPVRHKEFTKNIRREYSRLLGVLHAYALVAKNVRFVCSHLTGKSRTVILNTRGTSSIKDNVITVFGTKMAASLEPVDLSIGSDRQIEGFISKPGAGSGRASADRQFFYINNRPVELPKVSKMLNELYRSFNSQQYPMAVLNFIIPAATYDVNVTPDKRKVFLHAENELLLALRQSLENVYAPDKYTYSVQKMDSTPWEKGSSMPRELLEFETQKCETTQGSLGATSATETHVELSDHEEDVGSNRDLCDSGHKSPTIHRGSPADCDSFQCRSFTACAGSLTSKERDSKTDDGSKRASLVQHAEQKAIQSKLTAFVMPTKRPAEDIPLLSEEPLLKKWLLSPHNTKKDKDVSSGGRHGMLCANKHVLSKPNHCGVGQNSSDCHRQADSVIGEPNVEEERVCSTDQSSASLSATVEGDGLRLEDCSDTVIIEAAHEIAASKEQEPNLAAACVGFDLKKLRTRFEKGLVTYEDYATRRQSSNRKGSFHAASMGVDIGAAGEASKEEALAAATRELERTFNKADFKKMKVLGQFNLGFILAKLNSDLFIIDQHASDEKYNFERLAKTTVLNRQPLLRPLPLELSAAEEVIISTHIETFRKNGFDFIENHDGAPGRRMSLSAVPFSKNIMFGSSDVQELVSLLAEEPILYGSADGKVHANGKQETSLYGTKSLIRPSRVRAMLASRACRSSIMIGDALSKKEMQKILSHLSELDSPWNCPHGRPTMRHLVDLTNIRQGVGFTNMI